MVINPNKGALKAGLLKKTALRKHKLADASDLAALVAKKGNQKLLKDAVFEYREISSLKPTPKRIRKPNPALMNNVTKSILEHGFLGGILVRGNEVLDGNIRVEAMAALGEKRIRVIDVGDLDETRCRLLAVSINRLAELGDWDLEVLRDAFIEFEANDLDLDSTGFTSIEIDTIKLDPIDEAANELDSLPKPNAETVSKNGDLWVLHESRLLCGSATNAEDWACLMDGRVACAMITDPPYNVPIGGNVSGLGKIKHGEFIEGSGEKSQAEFRAFLRDFLQLGSKNLISAAVAYVFMDWRSIGVLQGAGDAAGFRQINMIVWDKQLAGMGSMYRSQHELTAVMCNNAASPKINNVKLGAKGRNRTNVWQYPGATQSGSCAAKMVGHHPTPKPVAMIVDMMLDATAKGDLVVDPFMGSGTTIIAGLEAGRIVAGIEKDPKFVDLAVRRWEAETGETATLAATGESFAEVRARRLQNAAGD